MKKENENIFLHIINENYKTCKQKQSECCDVTGKAILFTELEQTDASVLEQLRKMHGDFSDGPLNSLDDIELYSPYQKITTEKQELLNRKQDPLLKAQDLQKRLLKEIGKKKEEIKALRIEISVLQNKCEEISQGLQSPNGDN